MSDLYQDRKGTLTGDGLKGLAKIVADKLPAGSVVTAAILPMAYNVGIDEIEYADTIEYETVAAGDEKPLAIIVVHLEERIHSALDQFIDDDDWSFDSETLPVLVFTIESDCDYYDVVAITVDMQEDVEVDETALLQEIIDYIEDNTPAAEYMQESEPDIFTMYGSLTDSSVCYDTVFDGDDEEEEPDDGEEPDGQ